MMHDVNKFVIWFLKKLLKIQWAAANNAIFLCDENYMGYLRLGNWTIIRWIMRICF